jgi:hypothetical protein
MADSPPRPPIHERSDEELLDDLSIELRHVGCGDYDLPAGKRVLAHIKQVADIHTELNHRKVDWHPRLQQLSDETKWQMVSLLDDCLAYPQRLPFVRELDGIRRALRCRLCGQEERPVDAKLFWFCKPCMERVAEALRTRAPLQGIVLFRTYNSECRCSHANADTVLAGESYIEQLYGICGVCIHDELKRRAT